MKCVCSKCLLDQNENPNMNLCCKNALLVTDESLSKNALLVTDESLSKNALLVTDESLSKNALLVTDESLSKNALLVTDLLHLLAFWAAPIGFLETLKTTW